MYNTSGTGVSVGVEEGNEVAVGVNVIVGVTGIGVERAAEDLHPATISERTVKINSARFIIVSIK
jgi:hypothetical protein